jgi:hypothetical protein
LNNKWFCQHVNNFVQMLQQVAQVIPSWMQAWRECTHLFQIQAQTQ